MSDERDPSHAPTLRGTAIDGALDDEPTARLVVPSSHAAPVALAKSVASETELRALGHFDRRSAPNEPRSSAKPVFTTHAPPRRILDAHFEPERRAAPRSPWNPALAPRISRPVLIAHFEPEIREAAHHPFANPNDEAFAGEALDESLLPRRRAWVFYAAASLITVAIVVPLLLALRDEPRFRATRSAQPAAPTLAQRSVHPLTPAATELRVPAAAASAPPVSSASGRERPPSKPRGEQARARRPRTLDGVDIETPLITD